MATIPATTATATPPGLCEALANSASSTLGKLQQGGSWVITNGRELGGQLTSKIAEIGRSSFAFLKHYAGVIGSGLQSGFFSLRDHAIQFPIQTAIFAICGVVTFAAFKAFCSGQRPDAAARPAAARPAAARPADARAAADLPPPLAADARAVDRVDRAAEDAAGRLNRVVEDGAHRLDRAAENALARVGRAAADLPPPALAGAEDAARADAARADAARDQIGVTLARIPEALAAVERTQAGGAAVLELKETLATAAQQLRDIPEGIARPVLGPLVPGIRAGLGELDRVLQEIKLANGDRELDGAPEVHGRMLRALQGL